MIFEDPADNDMVALLRGLRTHDVSPRRAARLRGHCRLRLARHARPREAAPPGWIPVTLVGASVLYAGAVLVRAIAFYAR
ncbi:MAG: hypothetical protein ACRD1U_07425 [Vicinamibacterales bacterium]